MRHLTTLPAAFLALAAIATLAAFATSATLFP
jgi:hypothetical protein